MRSDDDEVRLITVSHLEYGPGGRIAANLTSYIPAWKVCLNPLCTLVRESLCLMGSPFPAFLSVSLNLGDANRRHVIGWQFVVRWRQDDVSHGHDYCVNGHWQSGAA